MLDTLKLSKYNRTKAHVNKDEPMKDKGDFNIPIIILDCINKYITPIKINTIKPIINCSLKVLGFNLVVLQVLYNLLLLNLLLLTQDILLRSHKLRSI